MLTKASFFLQVVKVSERQQAVEDGRQRGAISLRNRDVQSLSAPESQCANKKEECPQ